jgi:hypothetical protein
MKKVKENDMKTLIRVLKVVGGKEYWYRVEGSNSIVIEFVGGY